MGSDWEYGDGQAGPCMGWCMGRCMGGGGMVGVVGVGKMHVYHKHKT